MAAEGPYLTGRDRLRALEQTGLGSTPDEALDRYARMVQTYLGVPTALVSLVDSARQFFPGAAGLCEPWDSARETPLTHSICQYVVGRGEPVVSSDIRADPELSASLANPVLGVVAYAGMPLTDANGHILGVLCAIDTEPRIWASSELEALADLAAACSSEIRLRTAAASAQAAERQAARDGPADVADRRGDAHPVLVTEFGHLDAAAGGAAGPAIRRLGRGVASRR